MKYAIILSSSLFLVVFAATLPVTGSAPVTQAQTEEKTAQAAALPDWEVPIAAGVWYPSDGKVPQRTMRYYRVRCWPGCHTGSSLGKYPHKTLRDKPIWPTSTVNAHSKGASQSE